MKFPIYQTEVERNSRFSAKTDIFIQLVTTLTISGLINKTAVFVFRTRNAQNFQANRTLQVDRGPFLHFVHLPRDAFFNKIETTTAPDSTNRKRPKLQ